MIVRWLAQRVEQERRTQEFRATPPPSAWGKIDEALAKELLRQAEKKLDSLAATAQSLDQRALAYAAMAISGGGVAAGLAIAQLAVAPPRWWLLAGATVTAVIWLVAAILAWKAARPRGWRGAGEWPQVWYPMVQDSSYTLAKMLGHSAEAAAVAIAVCEERNARAIFCLRWAAASVLCAPWAGAVVALAAWAAA